MKKALSLLLAAAFAAAALPATAADTAYHVGDVNFDGGISADDLTDLARHVGGIRALPSGGDVNVDGAVTADDLTDLARHVGGISPLADVTIRNGEYESNGLRFALNADGASYAVTGYSGSDTDLFIPSEHNSLPVTDIASEDGIAPFDPETLTSITIPASVRSLPTFAFYGCRHLTRAVLSDGVEEIGLFAFADCPALTDITLPGSVKLIGENAFLGTGYYNDEQNWQNGLLYLGSHLIAGSPDLTSCTVRAGTRTIADGAFRTSLSLEAITLPESLERIGNGAFEHTAITAIDLPERLECIGSRAFAYTALQSVTMPDNIRVIGRDVFADTPLYRNKANWENGILYVGKHLIKGAPDLTSCVIREGTLTIADGAFELCANLGGPKATTLPESVCVTASSYADESALPAQAMDGDNATAWIAETNKNEWIAFSWGEDLTLTSVALAWLAGDLFPQEYTVEVSEDDTEWKTCPGTCVRSGQIDYYAFSSAVTAKAMRVFVTVAGEKAPVQLSEVTLNPVVTGSDVIIPDSVKVIGAYAFAYRDLLKSLTIGKGVREIGENAFLECSDLERLTVSAENPFYRAEENCLIETATGTLLYGNKAGTIPAGVKRIAAVAFCGNASVKEVTVPAGVEEIGLIAFGDCRRLTRLTLPSGLKKLDEGAFQNCIALEEIVFGGTEREWNALEKGDAWDYNTGAYTVRFAD